MNKILKEDIESFSLPADLSDALRNKTVLLTGATGLIGSSFVRCVHGLNIGVRFLLPVRDMEKAKVIFKNIDSEYISLIDLNSIADCFLDYKCDYIVHCASPTNGDYMAEHPVETFNTAVEYTRILLEYGRTCPIGGMVYLSSIEYYGQIFNDEPVSEDLMGIVDHSSARNSYSIGKHAAEFLVYAYAEEYGVPAKTARLTQTFGAGISTGDKRVFAQFARSVVKGEKIVLHTQGYSAKPYCYITDCVAALVYILIKGKDGEAYNVATPDTYVSIRQLAEVFASFSRIEDPIGFDFSSDHGYAPETRVNLDCSKLLGLGWKPVFGLNDMVGRLIEYVQTSEQ